MLNVKLTPELLPVTTNLAGPAVASNALRVAVYDPAVPDTAANVRVLPVSVVPLLCGNPVIVAALTNAPVEIQTAPLPRIRNT
jgi:hypothetical protein